MDIIKLIRQHRPDIIKKYLEEKGDFEEWLETNQERLIKEAKEESLQKKIDEGNAAKIELTKIKSITK